MGDVEDETGPDRTDLRAHPDAPGRVPNGDLVRAAVVGALLSVPAWKLWDLTQDCEGLACLGNVLVVVMVAPVALPLLAWLGCTLARVPRPLVCALLGVSLAAVWSYPLGELWWDQANPYQNPAPPLLTLAVLDAALFATSVVLLRHPWRVRGWALAALVVVPLALGPLVRGLLG